MIDLTNIDGVIFDLDGTLVESSLDFAQIRADIGCPEGVDVLHFIEQLPDEQRQHAHAVVLSHELDDARLSNWLSGAQEFVLKTLEQQLPMAIVTRNCRAATERKIQQNNIPIDCIITREDAPAKPKPDALIMIAQLWQLPAHRLIYIGDYIYDEQAAINAGMQFCYSPFGQ
ncbi:HAD family hydrolase [Alteromonas facilis]|uniref:HAD family hydrolase n=1 Tax=Alteromonas facilis TaxID=2048004 RepID=UPI000C282E73|nr:HAD-IA family hydrolase [Alteromonas facilis]